MMGGNEYNDDGAVEVSLNGRQTDCRDDIKEGQWRVMGVDLSGRDIGDCGDLANNGLCEQAEGGNSEICIRGTNVHFSTGTESMEGSSMFLMC